MNFGVLIGFVFGSSVVPTLLFFGLAALGLKAKRLSPLGWGRGLKLFGIALTGVFVCNLGIYLANPEAIYSSAPSIAGLFQSLIIPLCVSASVLMYLWKNESPSN